MANDITGIDIINLADDAKNIKDELEKAEQIKCTCSGFALQYQGCGCERGKALKKARAKVIGFFDGL
ncbi:hypothetical protein LCGC14_2839270 [marine sediment metagenome]|uniref:Uncharacterized protein n=1 Tax=marine sediment metagenome TaxID=412755 RepID=A0A0F8YBR0_9ZZZZ